MKASPATPAIRAALKGHDPSEEQWAAITHDTVPLVIVAGAGSGKTAIMAARMVWMTEQGVARPSRILGLTFTNKAAGELEERIEAAFAMLDPHPQEEPYIATYHSFADRLVREHGVRIGIDPEVGLLSEAQKWQLLLREFDNLPPFDAVDSRSAASIVRTALGLADQCANHLVTPERIIAEDERILTNAGDFNDDVVLASRRRIEIARVVRAYFQGKERARRIDFGDQVTKAVDLLERFPDLVTELQERYPAILLDEYQDTNVAQRKLMQLLAPEGHNITAVGDARQNIFQWRGSTLFNLIDFPKRHFLRRGRKTHTHLSLSQNYRSGSRILAVANRVIDRVPEGRRPGRSLVSDPRNREGFVAVRLLSDQYEEAHFIASEIEALHNKPASEGRDSTGWGDFAILVRRKAHIGRIYDALGKRDIPVEVVGLGGLLQVPEVMDTIAWLRVIADPGPPGNRWLARILLGPRFRIHYRDLALLARWATRHTVELAEAKRIQTEPQVSRLRIVNETEFEPDDVAYSLAEALEHLDEIENLGAEARIRLERARNELKALRPKAGGSLLDLVQAVVSLAGIAEALDVGSPDRSSSRANLTSFLGSVAGFAPVSGEASLAAFLAYLDAAEEIEETLDLATPAASDSVKLMTVHQAKGLEFEVVFIPGVAARENEKGEKVDSVFPDTRTSNPMTSYGQLPYGVREDAEHLPTPWLAAGGAKKKVEFARELRDRAIEDERRLFYVALTRAKQRVYVTAAWWYERQNKPKGPSEFFEEVASASGIDHLQSAEMPPENPLFARLSEMAVWPPVAHQLPEDPLFPDGYPVAVEKLKDGSLTATQLISQLPDGERRSVEGVLEEHRKLIEGLVRSRLPATAEPDLPATFSATQAIDLVAGRITMRELMRPLPERPSPARRIGTEIHRWIEERARGLTGVADEEAFDEPSSSVEPSRIASLRRTFVELEFDRREPARLDTGEPMTELKFVVKVGDRLIRGRMDAVYEIEDGLEVVDFKTGAQSEQPEVDQLALYAAALASLPVRMGSTLKLTYCYLSSGETVSRIMSPSDAVRSLDALATRLEERLD